MRKRVECPHWRQRKTADESNNEESRGHENETRSESLEWEVTGEPQHDGSPPRKFVESTDFPVISFGH